MTEDAQVYDPLIYELAALGRDEPDHTITGETREEIRESLLGALNAMNSVASKAVQYRKKLGENNVE